MARFRSGSQVGEWSFRPGSPTSVYGSADMLMSLAVLGKLDLDEASKDSWAATINRFQDRDTGLYLAQDFEPHAGPAVLGHHDHEHTTAFAIAALRLIDRRPVHPLVLMLALQRNRSGWEAWLSNAPELPSWDHRASGIYASLAMTGQLDSDFGHFYFNWLNNHTDPTTGYVCPPRTSPAPTQSAADGKDVDLVGDMTCYAHISWQYVFAGGPWPHPSKMVDAGLAMQNASSGYFCAEPGWSHESPSCQTICTPTTPCTANGCCGSASSVLPSCHQLDGIWTVTRSSALAAGYRKPDVAAMCAKFLSASAAVLNDDAVVDSSIYGDSHGLNGALQAVAECARWFPSLITTTVAWNITLEAAPFM